MSFESIPSQQESPTAHSVEQYSLEPKFLEEINHRMKSRKRIGTRPRNQRLTYRHSLLGTYEKFKLTQHKIPASEETGEQPSKKTFYINGNRITASWKNYQLDGDVIINYQTGEYFQGRYKEGVRVNGLLRYNDGTEYQGKFQNDKFHGTGRLTDPTKRKVICEWHEGVPSKKGKIEYPNGDIYCGEIQKLRKHGEGFLFFKEGKKFLGQFLNGKINGYGKYYDGEIKVAEGFWIDGVLSINKLTYDVLTETLRELATTGLQNNAKEKEVNVKSWRLLQMGIL